MGQRRTTGSGITIGRLAKAAGVSVETVRYYERSGLLARPPRRRGSYRRYPHETIDHIRFIKRVQSLGFALRDIRALLCLETDRPRDNQAVARTLLQEVQRRLQDLRRLETVLRQRASASVRSRSRAPIVTVLAHES